MSDKNRKRLRGHLIAPLPAALFAAASAHAVTAVDDQFNAVIVSGQQSGIGNVLDNDIGQTLSATLSSLPAHGSAQVLSTGDVTYQLFGCVATASTDSFRYIVQDSGDASQGNAIAHISFLAPGVADAYSTNAGAPVSGNVRDNDLPSGDTRPVALFTSPSMGGDFAGDTGAGASNGQFTYTPPAGFSGVDHVGYLVNSGLPGCNTVTSVDITVFPVASDDLFETRSGSSLNGNVLANDVGSNLTVTSSTQPAHGVLNVSVNGDVDYTPNSGFTGADSFGYGATDSSGNSTNAVVQVQVSGAVQPDSFTGPAGATLAGNVLSNDIGTNLSVTGHSSPSFGVLNIGSNGAFTYVPAAQFSGLDSFSYSASDSSGSIGNTLVQIDITPVAVADHIHVVAPTAFDGNVIGNDIGTGLHVVDATQPAHGTANVTADGSFSYSPVPGYAGPDAFQYTVQDADGQSASSTVSITVQSAAGSTTAIPTTTPAALGLLGTLLAWFGLRRRRRAD